jgi:hypothetical protein
MVGSAGPRPPASPPAACRSQACRRTCPAHDAGVHLRPRLGPANSLSAVRVRGRRAVMKDVGVRPPNDGQAAGAAEPQPLLLDPHHLLPYASQRPRALSRHSTVTLARRQRRLTSSSRCRIPASAARCSVASSASSSHTRANSSPSAPTASSPRGGSVAPRSAPAPPPTPSSSSSSSGSPASALPAPPSVAHRLRRRRRHLASRPRLLRSPRLHRLPPHLTALGAQPPLRYQA